MNARCIALIAQERGNWAPAGDNLFIDLDLSPANTPPGTRLAIGTAVIEITDTPHNGCDSFIARYGRDACVFVNTGEGKRLRLRGIYGRVVQDGRVSVGDVVSNVRGSAQASERENRVLAYLPNLGDCGDCRGELALSRQLPGQGRRTGRR